MTTLQPTGRFGWLATAGFSLLAASAALAVDRGPTPTTEISCHAQPGATTVRRIRPEIPIQSLQTMAREASNVLYGRVVSANQVTPEGAWPYVEYRLEIYSELKRPEQGPVHLRVLGGPGVELLGAPEVAIGQDAVVFTHDNADGTAGLLGLRQGYYRVEPTPTSDPTIRGIHAPNGVALADFLQRVEALLYTAAGQEVR